MSALGHKRTCAAQKVMSALSPKADMCDATRGLGWLGRLAWSGVSREFTYSIVVPLAEPFLSDTFAFQAQAVHAVEAAVKFR